MTTPNHILEDNNFHNHCCKNFISHMGNFCLKCSWWWNLQAAEFM